MSDERALRRTAIQVGTSAVILAAALLTSGFGGKDVTFTPAGQTGSGALTPTVTGQAADGGTSPPASSAASTALPSNIVVTTQGSSICVSDTASGSKACVGKGSDAVVNGVVIKGGKVVGPAGSGGGGGSTPVPTTGDVTLEGAVRWQGRASGTCRRDGQVRHTEVTLAGGGQLEIDAVGGGVLEVRLVSGGTEYSGEWVGQGGLVTVRDGSLSLNRAPVGRGSRTVQVSATLNC